MNVIVCVKHAPDSETQVKIAPDGISIDESAVKFDINPYDEYALEAAVELKEKYGGEVTTILLGDEGAARTARKCLAAGADKAIHLIAVNSRMEESRVIAQALADEIRNSSYNVILCGKKSIDTDSHQVGVLIAQLLNIPFIAMVNSLEIMDNTVISSRDIEGAKEIIECSMPCLITAEKGLNKPRYPSLRDIMMAKKKPIETRSISLEGNGIEITKMEYPPARKAGKIVGEGAKAVPELVNLLKTETKVI